MESEQIRHLQKTIASPDFNKEANPLQDVHTIALLEIAYQLAILNERDLAYGMGDSTGNF